MSRSDFDVQAELKKLPAKPGVYLMHDETDEIIYVGKAKILRNRVKQYFSASYVKSTKILKMVSHIAWFEYIVTDSELEALVLECNLIKEHRPRYNTMLMDDKGYPYISVTVGEMYPRVFMTRSVLKDGARYFGPYTSAFAVKTALETLRALGGIRTCRRVLPRDAGKQRPCLNYDMGRCLAPCTGKVDPVRYKAEADRIVRFLSGDHKEIIRDLKKQMQDAAAEENFEEAIRLRDLLSAMEHLIEDQKITSAGSDDDRDFIACALSREDAVVSVFFIRGGKLKGRDHFHMKAPEFPEEEGEAREAGVLSAFVKQFYAGTPELPKEVFLMTAIPDPELVSDYLSAKKGAKVALIVPKKGEKEHFMELAKKNAAIVLDREKGRFSAREQRNEKAMAALRSLLGLQSVRRIEAFDISNVSGFESVGSMVVFIDGEARKNDYRKFRIKTVSGPDDYASMAEVLGRRYAKKHREDAEDGGLTEEERRKKAAFGTDLPDLILMDGGKGQVHVAEEVLLKAGLSIPVAGMVKDDRHRTRGLYFHDVELPIDTHGEAFHLITRVQDEAHRFAVTFHRGLHQKNQIRSVLSEIPGVGAKRENVLIRSFTDISALKNASTEELSALPGFNARVAGEIYAFLHKEDENG